MSLNRAQNRRTELHNQQRPATAAALLSAEADGYPEAIQDARSGARGRVPSGICEGAGLVKRVRTRASDSW